MNFIGIDRSRPLRVFTAFSGYDSQCMALDRLGIPYELIGWSEIDPYAIKAHNAVYPQWADRNLGDISKISWGGLQDFDLFTYSFPCTDISNAGLQKGLAEGSGSRSSLLWECRKAIEIKKPKYLLMENVKALIGKKFIGEFKRWDAWLVEQGYTNFSQVLNAKDFGVPQNRERIFMVSILDCEQHFEFPTPFPLEKKLKDVLEEKTIKMFLERNRINEERGNGFKFEPIDPNSLGGGYVLNQSLRTMEAETAITISSIAKTIRTSPNNRADDNFILEYE